MSNNKKRIYGLIGYPVKHSLSPAMHNAAFKALGMDSECEYHLFEMKPEDLNSFLSSLDKNNIYGLNVTIPYKEKILDFVSIDAELLYLREIGAINTIVNKNNIWKGFNTDISGFLRALKEQFEPKNKKVAVLGAGGAGRAVCYSLAKSGAKQIAIFDIYKTKSEDVAKMIKSLFVDCQIFSVNDIEELYINNKDLLINATPIGLKEEDPCLIKKQLLHKDLFIYDLIYNPTETKLLKLAREKGCRYSNGLAMLLYQGMLSFEIWTDKPAPKEVMQKALLEALKCL